MAYADYLNQTMTVYRAAENVKDVLGDVVEDPFTEVGSYDARIRNLSGNQQDYLQRNTVEDYQRVYTVPGADVRLLDVILIDSRYYAVRRLNTPEQTQVRHHIELDVVGYDVNFTLEEAEYPDGEHPVSDWINRYIFNSGDIEADETGSSDLINAGAVSVSDGTRGDVVEFNGSSAEMTNVGEPTDTTDTWGYCFWVKLDAIGDVVLGSSGTNPNAGFIQVLDSTTIRVSLKLGGANESLSFTVPTISLSSWVYISVTCETNNIRVYLNGVESSSGNQSKTEGYGIYITKIGYNIASFLLDGRLDNLTVYDRAISGAEVLQIYNYELIP